MTAPIHLTNVNQYIIQMSSRYIIITNQRCSIKILGVDRILSTRLNARPAIECRKSLPLRIHKVHEVLVRWIVEIATERKRHQHIVLRSIRRWHKSWRWLYEIVLNFRRRGRRLEGPKPGSGNSELFIATTAARLLSLKSGETRFNAGESLLNRRHVLSKLVAKIHRLSFQTIATKCSTQAQTKRISAIMIAQQTIATKCSTQAQTKRISAIMIAQQISHFD